MKDSAVSLARMKDRRGVFIALAAAILVPLIFAAIILTPTWGPYDNLSNLPVAVVNEDEGALSGETPVNVGKDLVADLKKNKTLGWDFVDAREAEEGMKNLDYYMVIQIPKDFSQRVTTVLTDNPTVPELVYTQNEGLHFMAAQVTKSATERIREQLANKITATYAQNMFDQLSQIASGFTDGADGSNKLHDGSVTLKDGTGQILQSLQSKSGDISKLADGTQELKSGTDTLLQSLQSKAGDISKLAAGTAKAKDGTGQLLQALQGGTGSINQLAAGSKELQNGANSLQDGSSKVLTGLKSAQAGSKTLNDGLAKLAPGSKEMAAGVGTAVDAIGSKLEPGAQQVAAGIEQMSKHPMLGPILAVNPDFQKLLAGSKELAGGLNQLKQKSVALKTGADQLAGGLAQAAPGASQLKAGLDQLVAGQSQVVQGSAKLAGGAAKLANGNASLTGSWGKLTNSVATLDNGMSVINDGNHSVDAGWKNLTTGAQKLNSGMTQVNDGNQTVKVGWNDLTAGVQQVDNGILQLQDGSKQLASGLQGGASKVNAIKVNQDNINMFSSPVELTGKTIHSFPMYRYANAPYILSLALFVGVLVLTLLFDIHKPYDLAVSSFRWYFGIYAKLAGLAAIQAIIMSAFALFFIRLSVSNGILLMLFAILASVTFLAMVFFLIALAGNIGRFLAVAFLVLQLSTTGASLPVAMLPEGLRALSSWLPMRYSIDSFRALVSLDNTSSAWGNLSILLIYLIVSILLISLVALFSSKRHLSSDRPLEA
ncbi:YhgE/Pip family protein [Bacillus testis]|uniref:YhgE/Pip family protein n=1 Tax=Bacillus testis TaxID=1622072 RepID=UPI00067F5DFD|nr:YhgE/Pip domain-containing protein [Bacillus testis]